MKWKTITWKYDDGDIQSEIFPIERSKKIYKDLINLLKNELEKSDDEINSYISEVDDYISELDYEYFLSPEDLTAAIEFERVEELYSIITFNEGPDYDARPYRWGEETLKYIGCSDEEISELSEYYVDFEIEKYEEQFDA